MRLHRFSLARSMSLVAVIALAFAWLRSFYRSVYDGPNGVSVLGFEETILDLVVIGMAILLPIGLIVGLHRCGWGLAFLLCGSGTLVLSTMACWLFPDAVYDAFRAVAEPILVTNAGWLPPEVVEEEMGSPFFLWPLILLVAVACMLPQVLLALLGAYTIGMPLITLLGILIARSGPLADEAVARHHRVEEIERKLERALGELEELRRIADDDRTRG